MPWIVRCGLVTAWRMAVVPMICWPSSVNATTDGNVRWPRRVGMIVALPFSITATHELVVPRSTPIVFAMSLVSGIGRPAGWVATAGCAAAGRTALLATGLRHAGEGALVGDEQLRDDVFDLGQRVARVDVWVVALGGREERVARAVLLRTLRDAEHAP